MNQKKLRKIQRAIERFFYKIRLNVAVHGAIVSNDYSNFRDKIADAIEKQIRYFAKIEKVDEIIMVRKAVKKLKNKDFLEQIAFLWIPLTQFVKEAEIREFLMWATERGGQSTLNKLNSDKTFELEDKTIIKQINKRAKKVIKMVDKTTQDWIARTIEEGLNNNLTSFEIAKLLGNEAKRQAKIRADKIAENEAVLAMGEIEEEIFKRNNIKKKKWISSRDEITCPVCLANEEAGAIPVGDPFPSGHLNIPAHIACYDKETEVYTDRGWLLFKNLRGNEKILSLNPKDFSIEWLKPQKYIAYKFEGRLIHFNSNQTDLMVTPNHDMLVGIRNRTKDRKYLDWRIEPAERVIEYSEFRIPKWVNWEGSSPSKIRLGNKEVDTETYCKFMGYYLSEGSTTKRSERSYQIKIPQCHKGNLLKIYEDIKNLPWKVNMGKEAIYIADRGLGIELMKYGRSHQRHVPPKIKGMNKELIKIFLDAYILGDGYIQKGRTWKGYRFSDSTKIVTSSKKMAGDLGELILKSGKTPSFHTRKAKGKIQEFRNGKYKINHDFHIISVLSHKNAYFSKNQKGTKINSVYYNDFVYDVELPRNHILWVRRNGKVIWSGNCRCIVLPIFTGKIQVSWTGK